MENYKNIPESLKTLKQWVCFKLEYNESKGKNDKIPKNPYNGYNAKANDEDVKALLEAAAEDSEAPPSAAAVDPPSSRR